MRMNPPGFCTSAAQETFPHLTQTNRVLTIIRLLRESAADKNKITGAQVEESKSKLPTLFSGYPGDPGEAAP